jgi:hypothetical protein
MCGSGRTCQSDDDDACRNSWQQQGSPKQNRSWGYSGSEARCRPVTGLKLRPQKAVISGSAALVAGSNVEIVVNPGRPWFGKKNPWSELVFAAEIRSNTKS